MDLIKFLLYLLAFYLIYRFIRFLIIIIYGYWKLKKHIRQNTDYQSRTVGEINIKTSFKENKNETSQKDGGEYIEFEEMKE
jgi:hypothetical protein